MKKYTLIVLFICLINNAFGQQLKIYIANDNHDDLMWTAVESVYINTWVEALDYYLNLADTYANEPSEYQSRYTTDGTLWLWYYSQKKTPTEFNRLINRIKDGHITVPKNLTTMTYGGMTTEAVIRSMYYAGELERKYDLNLLMANNMENQTNTFGLASLWAGAGCKYSWKGICNCGTMVQGLTNAKRDNEIYWWKGLDNQKILMKWNSISNHTPSGGSTPNQSIGGYAEAYNPGDIVDYVSSNTTFKSRYPYTIIGAFGQGWDDLLVKTSEFITTAKNKTDANRKVIVSNTIDFFQDFEATYGANLNSFNASFGNEWELEQATLSEVSGNIKRNIEKMRLAEALASYVSIYKPTFMDPYEQAGRKAWIDLGTYYNHDWGPYGAITQSDLSAFYKTKAGSFTKYVNDLLNDASSQLAGQIQKTGSNKRFYVFNSLGWNRKDYADLAVTNTNVHVMDVSTNQEVPSQIVTDGNVSYLRILASDVPSIGYNVYEIVDGPGNSFPATATTQSSGNDLIVENDFYKITITPRGAISSLIDKTRNNKEFVKSSQFLNDLGASTGTLQIANNGPVSATIVATAGEPLAHKTSITVYKKIDRIDIKNEITENFDGTYSWVYNFNMGSPQLWHEELGSIIRADYLANGGHYSPKFARYDWFTLNHFADITGIDGTGITVSNWDCQFFKYGNSTTSSLDVANAKISVMAGFDGAISNQGGDNYFLQRFSLRPHDAYDQSNSMKFALEHQNYLFAKEITGGTDFPEKSFSLVSTSDPKVVLWTLKPAEDGYQNEGLVARTWNLNQTNSDYTISSDSFVVLSGKELTNVETPISQATIISGKLECSADLNQMKTYSFTLGPDNGNPTGFMELMPETKIPYLKPNPASEFVEIFNLAGSGNINIYTISGQLVKSVNFSGEKVIIDLHNFQKGIYLLKSFKGSQNLFTGKLIIE